MMRNLCALAWILIAGTVTSHAAPLPKLTLVLHWYAQADDGGYYTALEKGYYQEAGINLEIVQGGPNPNIEMHVSTEPQTLGIVPADKVLLAAGRGLPLVSVMIQNQHDPQAIMVHENSPVKTLADLSGKKVSVTFGATFFVYLQNHYQYAGTTVLPYTGSVAGFVRDPETIQQAFPHAEPFYAAQQGVKSRCLLVSESGFDPYRVVVASQKLLSAHPEWIAAFTRATYRGWVEFYRNPTPALNAIQKLNPTADRPGLEFAVAEIKRRRFLEGTSEKGETFGKSDPARWKTLGDQLTKCGLLKRPPDLKTVFTDAFSPEKMGVDVSSINLPNP